ncbi:Hvo_1808 family surface protein [Halomicroarcula limicola]|uniref:Hvo_1808 family surface protein n=1 Tax=Haloarcula limicola TaxID=1429915 RepID=A0A8J7Y431_9EURY|nr:Hvo_1808 family surface protein [Halomicroarcula limicola]MBV0924375.1 Hvo_1808 family surface protein [Halomicroarcula limicola]
MTLTSQTRVRTVTIALAVCLAAVTATMAVGTAAAQTETDEAAFEPNDSFENATQLEPGNYTGLNVTENDLDVYAVELNAGESLSAEIEFSHARGDLDLFLLGPNGSTLQAGVSETDGESVSAVAPEAGTYYLVVAGFQGASGPYDLRVNTAGAGPSPAAGEFEPNDDFETATPVEAGNYTGLNVTENDLDVYAVELSEGDTLSAEIEFSHARGDLELLLIGPERTVLQASTSSTDGESISHLAGTNGTYYLVVYGYLDGTGPYDLSVGVSSGEDGTPPAGPSPTETPGNETATPEPPTGETATDETASLADPESDRLGWERGYWANESLDVETGDGLSEAERRALVARSMARVEAIREREFERPVEFDVVSRAAYAANQSQDTFQRLVGTRYYNQVYEATFIVDEETDAYDVVTGGQSAAVGGFYAVGSDRFVLVVEDPDDPSVDEGILVHELTHALQHQTGLLDSAFRSPTLSSDARTGLLGLVEGDANYVMARYDARCANGTWECLPRDASASVSGDGDESAGDADGPDGVNLGVYLTGYQPYSDGPALVADIRERGGWDAVDAAYDSPPVSTEQTIHPERYPDERPASLDRREPIDGDWERFTTDTLGEAWLYSMFWYQDREYDIPVIDSGQVLSPDSGDYDTYNYTSAPSEGWANDRISLYANGDASGYVWVTAWDSEDDARQFADAYRRVLDGHGGESVGEETWRIPDEAPYGDAFRVVRDGRTVTVVNGPDADALSAIAPDVGSDDDGDEGGGDADDGDGEAESVAIP